MTPQQFQQLQQSAGVAVQRATQALKMSQQSEASVREELKRMQENAVRLTEALSRTQIERRTGDPHIQRVENIPGRRIPFDLLVDIEIPPGSDAVVQGSVQISQEGPFVAVMRMATLTSSLEYQFQEPGSNTVMSFQGRSFGRYRPIHSAWDLNDGQPHTQVVQSGLAFPGTGAPHIISPANSSPFRSMEGDFRVIFENAGSSFPRQLRDVPVPSTFWTTAINEPWRLGALDFFERGEVLSFEVLPLHPLNPAFGNLSGFAAGGNFPFIDSQYDAVEGINDEIRDLGDSTVDPITRAPAAILTIGFHGYRIVQPAGAGPY